jgi:hypothetical protein
MHERDQVPSSGETVGRASRGPGLAAGDSATIAFAAAAAHAGRPMPPAAVPLLQRAAGNSAVASVLGDDLDGSMVQSVIGSGGQPLDAPVQKLMESHFNTDLSGVRVHTDSRAGQSAAAINAQAYTAGDHIVFQRQHYQPGTDAGMRMLAHELTHVVQQRSGPVDGTPVAGGVSVSDPSDRFELAAERNADSIMQSIGGAGSAAAQRTSDDDELS